MLIQQSFSHIRVVSGTSLWYVTGVIRLIPHMSRLQNGYLGYQTFCYKPKTQSFSMDPKDIVTMRLKWTCTFWQGISFIWCTLIFCVFRQKVQSKDSRHISDFSRSSWIRALYCLRLCLYPLETFLYVKANLFVFEPCHEKTGFLHMQKQRRRSASR